MRKGLKNNIGKYRRKRKLEQTELAELAGVSLATVKNLEMKRPSFTPSYGMLAKLAVVLECKPEDLIKYNYL